MGCYAEILHKNVNSIKIGVFHVKMELKLAPALK
jgi:hypothetical protein